MKAATYSSVSSTRSFAPREATGLTLSKLSVAASLLGNLVTQ
jgi:hypothetical protein